MFILHKTIQDVTREILFEVDQIVFPSTPFITKGSEYCSQLRLADLIADDVFYLKDMLSWWLEDRENESWEIKSTNRSQRILHTLKGINMEAIKLCSFYEDKEIDESHYTEMVLSYIIKLGMIVSSLSDWMKFLSRQETMHGKEEEIHCSLGVIL